MSVLRVFPLATRAPAHSFIGRSMVETRGQVREAIRVTYLREVNK